MSLISRLLDTLPTDPTPVCKVNIGVHWTLVSSKYCGLGSTIEGLLSLCPPGSRVIVLGPSTPLSPLLYDYGVSFLIGSRITDEDAAIATIQQGATFPQVKGVRLMTMSKG